MASPDATMWCLASEKKTVLPLAQKAARSTQTKVAKSAAVAWEGDEDTPQESPIAVWTKVTFNHEGKLVLPPSSAKLSDELAYLIIKCCAQVYDGWVAVPADMSMNDFEVVEFLRDGSTSLRRWMDVCWTLKRSRSAPSLRQKDPIELASKQESAEVVAILKTQIRLRAARSLYLVKKGLAISSLFNSPRSSITPALIPALIPEEDVNLIPKVDGCLLDFETQQSKATIETKRDQESTQASGSRQESAEIVAS